MVRIKWTTLTADLRDAARNLRRSLTDTAVACGTLALALAGVLAVGGLYQALVLRELPGVRAPGRLVAISLVGAGGRRTSLSVDAVNQLAKANTSFEKLSGFSDGPALRVELDGNTSFAATTLFAPGCLELLGISPFLGASIPDQIGSYNPSVILGYDYWRRAFNADLHVVGRSILVGGARRTIIGVAPEGFTGLGVEASSDLMLPVNFDPEVTPSPSRPTRVHYALGRLRPDKTVDMARAELTARWPVIREATMPPGSTPNQVAAARALRLNVESFTTGISNLRGKYATPLRVLFSITIALLVIAGLSVGGLILARTLARSQEFATRLALGASRWQIARQILIEAGSYALLASGVAIPLSWWGRLSLRHFIWRGIVPVTLDVDPTWIEVGLAIGLAATIGAVIGAMAALTITLSPTDGLLGSRSVAPKTHRLGGALIAVQVALSLTLVFSAGLLVKSASQLERVPLGFQGDRVVLARLVPLPGGYTNLDAPSYYADLAAKLRALPGVTSVAYSQVFPSPLTVSETVAEAQAPPGDAGLSIALETVSPDFFTVVGAPLLHGRDFSAEDTPAGPAVAIVSRRLAETLFPSGALGQHIRIGREPARRDVEVIGIAGDLRLGDIRLEPALAVFRPYSQEPATLRTPIVLIRTATDPRALFAPLRQTVASLHREYFAQSGTVSEQISSTILQERTLSLVAASIGGLVLLLALVGLYGLLAQRVRLRTPELSVRMALGASPSIVQRLIALHTLRLVGVGTLLGLPLALLGSRLTRSALFDLSPGDPATLLAVVLLFVAVGVIASVGPCRRASSIDPAQILRS